MDVPIPELHKCKYRMSARTLKLMQKIAQTQKSRFPSFPIDNGKFFKNVMT